MIITVAVTVIVIVWTLLGILQVAITRSFDKEWETLSKSGGSARARHVKSI